MTPRELLLSEWSTVERVIRSTCRMRGLRGADAEDFASIVKVRLFENDCAIVAKFRKNAKFSTYLQAVVLRIHADEYNKRSGRWHASAEARRSGERAVELEKQVVRNQRSVDEVIGSLNVSRAEADAILARLPRREPRVHPVSLNDVDADNLCAREQADSRVWQSEYSKIAERTKSILLEEISRMDPTQGLVVLLQLEQQLSVAEIARALQLEQDTLYVLRRQAWKRLRNSLERAGITWNDLRDVIERLPDALALDWKNDETGLSKQEGHVGPRQSESS